MSKSGWTAKNIPSQDGKNVIITGSTSGIGKEAARELARAGANLTIAARNQKKAEDVIQELKAETRNDNIHFMKIDTSSLKSVREFADAWMDSGKMIDTLVLNAGISNVPGREESEDEFERQLATNYLGHFLMTSILFPYMKREGSRIVAVASLAHKRTKLHFEDLQLHDYSPMTAYSQSKLALLTFSLELAKRLKEIDSRIASIPVHPGASSTEITRGGDRRNPVLQKLTKHLFGLVGQNPVQGAWPTLYAATSLDAKSGVYYGPLGRGELKGFPGMAKTADYANDREIADSLWKITEDLVGQKFEIE